MTCVGSAAGLCDLHTFRYDLQGRRILDLTADSTFTAYIGNDYVYEGMPASSGASVEIFAFGERVAFKSLTPMLRTGSEFVLLWWLPDVIGGLGLVALLVLVVLGMRSGAFVLIVRRPAYAGVAISTAIILAIPPISLAGGGGGPSFYWELNDPLGSGLVLIDEDGARVRHKEFKPFGGEYAAVGTMQSERTYFAGHRRHDETGLIYMQARWMDPNSGTFLSIDPLVPDAFDPQSMNSFAYARNNPVSFTDPDGRCAAALMGGSCTWSESINGQTYVVTATGIPSLDFGALPGDGAAVSGAGASGMGAGVGMGSGMGGFLASSGGGGGGSAGAGSGSPSALNQAPIIEQALNSEAAEAAIGTTDIGVAISERRASKKGLEKATKILRRVGIGLGAVGVLFDIVDFANAETTAGKIAAGIGIAVGVGVVVSGGAPALLFAEGAIMILDATGLDTAVIGAGLQAFGGGGP